MKPPTSLPYSSKELDTPKATVSIKHKRAVEILKRFAKEDEVRAEKDEAAPRVFALLAQGKKLTAIVQETGYPPKTVKELHEMYLSLEETDLNHPSVPRRLAELERKVEKMTKMKPYWDLTRATVVMNPEVQPYCPNCMEKMCSAKIGWKCNTCDFEYP